MSIQLTIKDMKALFPQAPDAVLKDFVDKQESILSPAGINHTRNRLKMFFANIEHEVDGYTLKSMTEATNYKPEQLPKLWPSRFKSVDEVKAKFGTGKGWQLKALDDIYGNRMGNRPGTKDGSTFIGRGGPQITGRDGYAKVGAIAKLPLEAKPELATVPSNQAAICAAFWTWKGMNRHADAGDFVGCVKAWNGGTIGLADRRARMAGNEAIINRLKGSPPTELPPKAVREATTEKERAARAAGGGVVAVGTGTEVAKNVGAVQPDSAPQYATYGLVGLGIVIFITTTILIVRKHRNVIRNWY